MNLDWRWTALFLLPLALLLGVFMLVPAVVGLAESFTNFSPLSNAPWHGVGPENYQRALSNPEMLAATRNIAVLTLLTVSLELSLGLLLAFAMHRTFRGHSLVRILLLTPWLVSPIANGVLWHNVYNLESGLLNFIPRVLGFATLPDPLGHGGALFAVAIAEIWRKTPLVSFLVLPGMLGIPKTFFEHARLEGLNDWHQFWQVVFPRVRLLLLTTCFLLVADALAMGEHLLMLTGGGPGSATVTPALFSYQQAIQSYNWALGSTIAWLVAGAVAIAATIYLFIMRHEETS